MPSPQLVTTQSKPIALAKSLTVSVFPVPVGPAKQLESLIPIAVVIVKNALSVNYVIVCSLICPLCYSLESYLSFLL